MCISIRTCTFRERERSIQRDILCQPILFCDWSPSQAKNSVTAHLGLAYLITTFLHPQEIILYQDLVASGSVVHHSPKPPVTWWWNNAVWSNTLSSTMYSFVSSSIQLLFQGLKFSFEGSGIFARCISEYGQVWSYQSTTNRELWKSHQRGRCQVQECISHF